MISFNYKQTKGSSNIIEEPLNLKCCLINFYGTVMLFPIHLKQAPVTGITSPDLYFLKK